MGTILRYPFRPQEGSPAESERKLAELQARGWKLTRMGFQLPERDQARGLEPEPDAEEVRLCTLFLYVHALPRESFNERADSYRLKHDVERWLEAAGCKRHISNGALIVAAVRMGFPFRLFDPPHQKDAFFRMGLFWRWNGSSEVPLPVDLWPAHIRNGRTAQRARR
ncbi:MAG: hypothetical protein AMXMBFR7_16310 [Planctomycetota bacterium]